MRKWHLLLFALLFCATCRPPEGGAPDKRLTYLARNYEGQLLHHWVVLTLGAIQEQQLSTPEAGRVLGYIGLAAWEAVCQGVPQGRSLSGQIRDYEAPAFDSDKVYDWGIVLCTTMRQLIPELLEGMSNQQRFALEKLAAAQEDSLMRRGLTERVRQDSRFWGGQVAAAIAARARRDGRLAIRQLVPVLPERNAEFPQYWTPVSPNPKPTEPLWSRVNTFVLEPNTACQPAEPLPYSTAPESRWYQEALELANIPKNTASRLIAFHWEDEPGHSSTAAGHWMNIARQLLEREGSHLADCARLYCLVGMAIADATSLSWSVKYRYFLLCPITYIRENIAANWTPLVFTPNHPEYISEYAAIAAASSALLTSELGDSGFIDRTHLGSLLYTPEGGPFVLPERLFGSLTQAAQEAAFAAVRGGKRFRRSCDEGWQAGLCVAKQVSRRLQFVR